MKYEEIKGAKVVGFISNGCLATGETCYLEVELEINGKLYNLKQTATKHPVMYLGEAKFA